MEENFIRDFIVLEILALWKKLCLLYPQQRVPTTPLLFVLKKKKKIVSPLECGSSPGRMLKNFWK